MKKTISLLLVLVMVFALCACGSGTDTTTQPEVEEEPAGLTEEDLENIAVVALYYEIIDQQKNGDPELNFKINPDQTRYKISLMEEHEKGYRVCGTFYMYDDYGQPVQKFWGTNGGSGGTSEGFEVIISDIGIALSCTIQK